MGSKSSYLLFHFPDARQQVPLFSPRGFLTAVPLALCDQRGPVQTQPLDVERASLGEAAERSVIRECEMLREIVTQRVQEAVR